MRLCIRYLFLFALFDAMSEFLEPWAANWHDLKRHHWQNYLSIIGYYGWCLSLWLFQTNIWSRRVWLMATADSSDELRSAPPAHARRAWSNRFCVLQYCLSLLFQVGSCCKIHEFQMLTLFYFSRQYVETFVSVAGVSQQWRANWLTSKSG